jgi:hypothetical protein
MRGVKWPIREPVVKPKRGGRAITDRHTGDRVVGVEFFPDDMPEVAATLTVGGIEGGSVSEQPGLPGDWFT